MAITPRKDATFISPYAATVPDDDFAESFAFYILEPERLQKECPSKYAFMHVDVFTEYRITRQREGLKAKFDAHILKAPHHGSHEFTPKFLQAVNPQITSISSGEIPDHGHPRANFLAAAGRNSRGDEPLL